MRTFAKVIHVLALGLWFGSIVFFSFFTALPIIRGMEQLAESKPAWLPGLHEKQQGIRLAGEALTTVFHRYFMVQGGCGIVAWFSLLLSFERQKRLIPLIRTLVITLALGLANFNLAVLAPEVRQMRADRYSKDPAVAEKATAEFSRLHAYSLGTDMATLVLVAVALSLSALRSAEGQDENQPSNGQSPEKTSTAGPVI